MKACVSIGDLVGKYGEPHHKIPQDGFEIWHYPLGVTSHMVYSIHVSVWPDGAIQVYMHMEPAEVRVIPRQRSWWKFWKGH
jgi:hypothetical protein